jgi:hypothetical protein
MGYPVIRRTDNPVKCSGERDVRLPWRFRVAANMAFKQAFLKGNPILLEPIMKTEVLVPEEFTGDVIGDLNARQGKIAQIVSKGSTQVLTANVPLSKMFGYSTALAVRFPGKGNLFNAIQSLRPGLKSSFSLSTDFEQRFSLAGIDDDPVGCYFHQLKTALPNNISFSVPLHIDENPALRRLGGIHVHIDFQGPETDCIFSGRSSNNGRTSLP